MRPGTTIIGRDTPSPRQAPEKTDALFVTGIVEFGREEAIGPITSMQRYQAEVGQRIAVAALLYDSADAYFRDGGSRLFVSPVIGEDAVEADAELSDTAPAVTLNVLAKSAGEWGNSLTISVEAGDDAGTFKLVVKRSGVEVERTLDFATKAEAIAWSAFSDYITLTDGPGLLDPAVVANVALAGGTLDTAGVVESDWDDAADRFDRDLGPGQIAAPGRTTAAAHGKLLDHGVERNRRALCDAPDSTSEATLKAASAALRSHVNARYGAIFGNWVQIAGLTPGTTRWIPPSVIAAALMARAEREGRGPNEPAAGINGRSVLAIDVRKKFTDLILEDLNLEGVNMFKAKYGRGTVRLYGYRTLVDPLVDDNWWMLSNSRYYMSVVARGDNIAERYVFAQLDGQRIKIGKYGGELSDMLAADWKLGYVFGKTTEEAFRVNVGEDVNPVEDLEEGYLRAVVALKMSPFAEEVVLELVKTRITEEV